MRNKLIKRFAIASVLAFTFSTSVLADGNGQKIEQQVDGIKVDLVLSGDKAKTGDNELTVKLYDDKNQPIDNANVKVTAEMDSSNMGDMNMSDSKPKAVDFKEGTHKGEYTGTVDFTDKGTWKIETDFSVNNQEKMANFNVEVANAGPNWFVVGGFLGIMAIIIITAGIMKKKSVRA